jgi:hypothetical protein
VNRQRYHPAPPGHQASAKSDRYTFHMETSSAELPDDAQDRVHYSTGRLTGTQAGIVNSWRARLLEDRPLPGRTRVGAAARLLGMDDRPPASCSDVIAAAVRELLGQAPGELEVARYAHAGWQAQKAAARGGLNDAQAPLYPPVSFYLAAGLAAEYDDLRERACKGPRAMLQELESEAARRFPEDQAARRGWLAGELRARGIPARLAKVPGGVLARMAIDRWVHRAVEQAVAQAVAYGADTHDQPHRGRRDMHELRR